MLALGIRYLNGFVAASEPDSYDVPEWPPHPGRIFMALAAAHFDTGSDPTERAALEWLERVEAPPYIRAGEASSRAVVTHYVPVNDAAGPAKAILQSAPALTRDRQPRGFARAWLDDDTVHVCWPAAEPSEAIRVSLEALCGKVSRLGHSMSLVQMWLAPHQEVSEGTWVPEGDRPEIQLRVAGPGTLDYLDRCYNRDGVEHWGGLTLIAADDTDKEAQRSAKGALKREYPRERPVRRRPELRLYQGYARPRAAEAGVSAAGSVFSSHLVVRTLEQDSGPPGDLDLLCAPEVVKRWREAILTQANDLPEVVRYLLSGHGRDRAPLEEPHLAFVPLAFVGHPHADGHLLGMGIALPDGLRPGDRHEALRAVARVERLLLGRLGTWRIGAVTAASPPWTLRSDTWTAHPDGATHWSTVTPIAFDRHPKASERASCQREISQMIAQACVRVSLPEPRDVIVTPVSAHMAVPPAHAFPRLQRKDGSMRRHAHAILVFDRPVGGPMLLGAGRYRGFGVLRPLDGRSM